MNVVGGHTKAADPWGGPAVGDISWPMARLVFVGSAALAAIVILGLASGLSFHGDEWAYIIDRRLTFESMLRPHNEHLVFLHVLLYRGMVELLGTASYLPFLATLMAVHVSVAAGVFALLSRYVPPAGALAGGVLMLFLGTGFDNLVWAFQTGFAGAIALGVWAMVVQRPWLSALLLTAALWTAGTGLFFVAPVFVLIRDRRWMVLPLASYAAWLLLIGRESVPFPGAGPYLAYAVTGIGSAFGGVAGLGVVAGWVIAAIVGVLLVRSGRPSVAVVAGLVGVASMFAILAFGRAHFGPEQAEAPRYIYAAAPFVLLALTGFRLPRAAWVGLFTVALVLNVWALPRGVAIYHAFVAYDRTLTEEQRMAPFR